MTAEGVSAKDWDSGHAFTQSMQPTRFTLNPPPLPADQCQAPAALRPGLGTFQMESIRPDNTDPIPLRPAPNQFGTIMLRFVGLLAVAIAVLAFVYSR